MKKNMTNQTQHKDTVEEVVEELAFRFCDNGAVCREDASFHTETEFKEELRTALTSHHQATLEEVRGKVKNLKKRGSNFHDDAVGYDKALSDTLSIINSHL